MSVDLTSARALDWEPTIPGSADLPGWLNRDLRRLVQIACLLGWELHVDSSGGGLGLVSPSGYKRIHLSQGKKSGPVQRLRRDIWKYADHTVKAYIKSEDDIPDDPRKLQAMMERMRSVEEARVDHPTPQPEQERDCRSFLEGVEHPAHRWYAGIDVEKVEPYRCPGFTATADEPASVTKEPTVVSSTPLLAKNNERTGYFSETTLVRVWSDGHKDYKCAECDFASDNRKSPSAHYARAHADGQGTAAKPSVFKADVPEAHQYAPRQTRVRALAEVLREMYDPDMHPDFEALALKALTWVHEQSGEGSDLAAEREPMTAEEMLARIRTLLDTGEQRRLLAEQEALTERVVELTARAEQAEQDRDRIRDSWRALSELVTEMGTEERQGA